MATRHTETDTHAEQEALDAIVQEARSVLARMDEIKQRFDSVGNRVERLNSALEQSKSALANASKRLEDASYHTIDNLGELVGDSETAHHGLFGKIGHWSSELKGAKDHFEQSTKHAQTAVDHSQSLSQQMLEQVKHTAHSFADRAKGRVNKLQEHVSELSKQFEAEAQPAMTGFDEFLQHMREQSESFVNNAHDHVEQFQRQTDDFVHSELIDPISEHANEAAQFLANVGHADIAGAVTGLMSQGREALEDGVKSVIGDLTDTVGQGIDEVIDAIHKSGDDNQLVREALKPVFEIIDSLIGPVSETIGNVKSVASAVGCDV